MCVIVCVRACVCVCACVRVCVRGRERECTLSASTLTWRYGRVVVTLFNRLTMR